MADSSSSVEIDENIGDGQPVLKDTGVPVEIVLRTLSEGVSFERIMKEFGLEARHIQEALNYAADSVSGKSPVKEKKSKFLIAEDLPNSTVKPFRVNDLECVHIRDEPELGTALDDEMFANNEGYIVVTRHPDRLKAEKGKIVVALEHYNPDSINAKLNELLKQIDVKKLADSTVYLEEDGHRFE